MIEFPFRKRTDWLVENLVKVLPGITPELRMSILNMTAHDPEFRGVFISIATQDIQYAIDYVKERMCSRCGGWGRGLPYDMTSKRCPDCSGKGTRPA